MILPTRPMTSSAQGIQADLLDRFPLPPSASNCTTADAEDQRSAAHDDAGTQQSTDTDAEKQLVDFYSGLVGQFANGVDWANGIREHNGDPCIDVKSEPDRTLGFSYDLESHLQMSQDLRPHKIAGHEAILKSFMASLPKDPVALRRVPMYMWDYATESLNELAELKRDEPVAKELLERLKAQSHDTASEADSES